MPMRHLRATHCLSPKHHPRSQNLRANHLSLVIAIQHMHATSGLGAHAPFTSHAPCHGGLGAISLALTPMLPSSSSSHPAWVV